MCSWYNICYSHCKLVYKGILQPHAETEVHDYCSLRKNLFFSYGFCLPRNTGTCNIAHTLFMFGTVYVPVYTCSSLSQDLSQEGSSNQDTQGHGRWRLPVIWSWRHHLCDWEVRQSTSYAWHTRVSFSFLLKEGGGHNEIVWINGGASTYSRARHVGKYM